MATARQLRGIDWLKFAASDVITSCCRCKGAAAMERFSRINSLQYYLTDIRGALDAAILLRQYDPARLAKVDFLVCTFLGLKMLDNSLTFRFLGFTFYTMLFFLKSISLSCFFKLV